MTESNYILQLSVTPFQNSSLMGDNPIQICIAYLLRSKYFISFHCIRKDRTLISTNYTFELDRFTIFFPIRKNKINALRYNSAYNCYGLSTTFKDCVQVYLLNDHLIKNIAEKRMLTHLFACCSPLAQVQQYWNYHGYL